MKLFKKIILGISIGVAGWLSAQKVDTKAKNLLDAVTTNYQSKNSVYFKFTYSTGSGKSAKNQTGIFYASKDKYRFKVMETEQIFDGKKIYSINEEDQEVTIAKPNGSEQLFSPTSYLQSYKKGYNITSLGKKNQQEIVKLTPIKNNGIKQVLLYINSAKKQIEKVEQYSTNNAVTSIIISQYKENPSITADKFTFNKNQYKNYLITEL